MKIMGFLLVAALLILSLFTVRLNSIAVELKGRVSSLEATVSNLKEKPDGNDAIKHMRNQYVQYHNYLVGDSKKKIEFYHWFLKKHAPVVPDTILVYVGNNGKPKTAMVFNQDIPVESVDENGNIIFKVWMNYYKAVPLDVNFTRKYLADNQVIVFNSDGSLMRDAHVRHLIYAVEEVW